MSKRVWMPLPDTDFDVTESAVPWKALVDAGHEVVFATERGAVGACDQRLLDGVMFGKLGAEPDAKRLYGEMIASAAFKAPTTWDAIRPEDFDGLVLAGGHAPGMRQFLGHAGLHDKVAAFFATGRPVGAICHGVVVAARARGSDGRSALFGRKTTCLPKYMERTAFFITAWRLGRYYRTYPAYVEDEVRQALASPDDFVRGPRTLTKRGSATDDGPAFVVEDGAYVSARWPGDAYLFAKKLVERLG